MERAIGKVFLVFIFMLFQISPSKAGRMLGNPSVDRATEGTVDRAAEGASDPDADSASSDGFPDSSFGRPPADPTRYMQASQPGRSVVDRAPAGMVFEGESAAKDSSASMGLTSVKQAPRRQTEDKDEGTDKQGHYNASAAAMSKASTVQLVPNGQRGIQEVAVVAGELGYFPQTIFVNRDIPVRLFVTGASKRTLCFMMDSFQVRRQVSSQKIEEITFTPSVPGQYRFYCPVNGMEGTMVVRELASIGR